MQSLVAPEFPRRRPTHELGELACAQFLKDRTIRAMIATARLNQQPQSRSHLLGGYAMGLKKPEAASSQCTHFFGWIWIGPATTATAPGYFRWGNREHARAFLSATRGHRSIHRSDSRSPDGQTPQGVRCSRSAGSICLRPRTAERLRQSALQSAPHRFELELPMVGSANIPTTLGEMQRQASGQVSTRASLRSVDACHPE